VNHLNEVMFIGLSLAEINVIRLHIVIATFKRTANLHGVQTIKKKPNSPRPVPAPWYQPPAAIKKKPAEEEF
jgi:hypothetical protein